MLLPENNQQMVQAMSGNRDAMDMRKKVAAGSLQPVVFTAHCCFPATSLCACQARRYLRRAAFGISGVWLFCQLMYILHLIVLWLGDSTALLIGMFHSKSYLADWCLPEVVYFLFYFLASSFTYFLTSYASFQECLALKAMNYKVNVCTVISKPIKLMKKVISLVLLHRRQ